MRDALARCDGSCPASRATHARRASAAFAHASHTPGETCEYDAGSRSSGNGRAPASAPRAARARIASEVVAAPAAPAAEADAAREATTRAGRVLAKTRARGARGAARVVMRARRVSHAGCLERLPGGSLARVGNEWRWLVYVGTSASRAGARR